MPRDVLLRRALFAAIGLLGAGASCLVTARADADAPPSPYAQPFGLRVPYATTAVRAETAYGFDAGASSTIVQYLTGSYAPIEHLSFYARGGWVALVPEHAGTTTAFTNVTVGAVWAGNITPELRFGAVLGTGLPFGQGGGDSPNAGAAAAIAAGNLARSRLESSTMFLPNDVAPFVAGDLAWVSGGWTLQAGASVYEALRVRGSQADPDASRTNLTVGGSGGYFVIPALSIGVEARDQTFLTTPSAVASGKSSRSWVTVGGGLRAHFRLCDGVWFRPGLAYFQPLNDPTPAISASSYHIWQLDLPLTF
jgi:hypothetical protein